MKTLHSKIATLRISVLVLAVLCLALGSSACSSGNSGEGAKWGTMGKGFAQKSTASSPQSHSSVLDLPLDGTLRGTVRDEEGQPLQGVTVYAVVPDDPHVFGMMTDAAGQYEIKFPKKWATEVQFSMLGKEKVTLPIGKKKKIDVVLKDEALELDPGLTMEDCLHIDAKIGVRIVKTLFLCNRQQTEFYLYVTTDDKPFVTREFCGALGIPRVSFASAEQLWARTGVEVGATTVLSAILPQSAGIHWVMDRSVAESEWFACTDGTATCFVKIRTAELLGKYLPAAGVTPTLI